MERSMGRDGPRKPGREHGLGRLRHLLQSDRDLPSLLAKAYELLESSTTADGGERRSRSAATPGKIVALEE
jgi:hypothetical protein